MLENGDVTLMFGNYCRPSQVDPLFSVQDVLLWKAYLFGDFEIKVV